MRVAMVVALLVGACVVVPRPARALVASDFLSRTVAVDGGSGLALPYRINVPAACASRRCPLLVFLHGSGETGSNNTAQLGNRANGAFQLAEAAATAGDPVIMAAPQAPEWWANEPPVGGIADMIDDIQREFGFDPARLYVTGLSMGGGGTIGFLQRYDAVAAAAVPICPAGAITSSNDRERLARMPMWFFHAVNDGTVDVANSRNSIATLRDAGGDPIYSEFATGNHNVWVQSYGVSRLVPWILAQRGRTPMLATDPWLRLDAPLAGALHATGASNLSLAGSSSGSAAVSAIDYRFGALQGAASGTATFAAGPLAVPPNARTLLQLRATGTSFVASLGGQGTFTRSVQVLHPVPTNRAPRVALRIEPVARVGRPLRLQAWVDDDGLPLATSVVDLQQLEGPATALLQFDAGHDHLAWWTPTVPGLYRFEAEAFDGTLSGRVEAAVLVLGESAPRPTLAAVNAGGPVFMASDGVNYAADAGFTGGTSESLTGLTTVIGTEDDALNRDTRRGASVRYAVPVANGRVLVRLHLSEWRWFTQVSRGMDVRLEGQTVLSGFDLFRWGGLRQALRFGFVAQVSDGMLDIEVARSTATSGEARMDAFEVLALPAGDAVFEDGFES